MNISIKSAYINKELIAKNYEGKKKVNYKEHLIIRSLEGVRILDIREILRIESSNNYCNIITKSNEKILVSKCLKSVYSKLDPLVFIRVHASHVVNSKIIKFFDYKKSKIRIQDNEWIPVSRTGKEVLNKWIRKMEL